jgi:hypothetical protein
LCGKVTARSSGLRWKRSETSTSACSLFGSRKVRVLSGVRNTARLLAWVCQKAWSSAISSIASCIGQMLRFAVSAACNCSIPSPSSCLSFTPSLSACWLSGVVGR